MGQPDILVYVGVDLVGDGLIKLPFVQALRNEFPSATLTWLAGRGPSAFSTSLAPLVVGLLDSVLDHPAASARTAWTRNPSIRQRKFDIIFDTQRGVMTTLALRRMRARLFISGSANFMLSDRRPPSGGKRPGALVQQLFQLLELATGRSHTKPPQLQLDAGVAALAAQILPPGPSYVALAPGAGGTDKIWPLRNFIWIAEAMAASGYVPVWFLGPNEKDLHDCLRALPYTAKFPLQETDARAHDFRADLTIALAVQCVAGLANDSGCGHMMDAARIPVVQLFGPTSPEKFAHGNSRSVVVRALDWGAGSMDAIPANAVLDALQRVIVNRETAVVQDAFQRRSATALET